MNSYELDAAKAKIHAEIVTDVQAFGEGTLIGVIKGRLDNREVVHKFRTRNSELEEMYMFYHKSKLIHQIGWVSVINVCFKPDNGVIINGKTDLPEQNSGTPIKEWLHTVPTRNLLEDLTEVWSDVYQRSNTP